ncbi:MAG: HlyD family efflux transporter periplasmic adaptor subunit [Oscillospiraceae bacterium]|jgi:multidrug resistance efflux pump|nr:HlyD family efflux transporter periplasmic adaptor subunit [Oscillospiraceae bacterium]
MRRNQGWIRRFACGLLAWVLTWGGAALAASSVPGQGSETAAAQGYRFSAKGRVAVPDSVTLTAPMGGQAENFTWQSGDAVTASALALRLIPTQLYAPNDGVVRGLRAARGELAEHAQAQYGALCFIARDEVWHVAASTVGGHNDAENRDIRVGDRLRARTGSGDDEVTGTGTVIAVSGRNFTLELPAGEFELEDSVKLYLGTGSSFHSEDLVGRGKVGRPPLLPVAGQGVVAEVLVADGDRVTRGQPLFVLDSAAAQYGGETPPAPDILFGTDAIVGEILVRPGQFVAQGQALMTLLPTGSLEAALEVDELDISGVALGQQVRVTVDAYSGRERMGTVRQIKPLGLTVLDTTKYQVMVTFEKSDDLLIGMHATGYWY